MSYSFTVTAPSKLEAILLVGAELDKVVASQPVHEADRAAAQATADLMVELLRDDPDMDVRVSVYGSIVAPTTGVTQASVGASATVWPREAIGAS